MDMYTVQAISLKRSLLTQYIIPFDVLNEFMQESHRKKKFLEKIPGNKNFGKNSQFSEVLGQNDTGNKVLSLRFLGLLGLLRLYFRKLFFIKTCLAVTVFHTDC